MEIQSEYQKAIDTFINRVLDRYSAEIDKIILFGSVARGEAGKKF
jgi:predicted nucleotidyltransferase